MSICFSSKLRQSCSPRLISLSIFAFYSFKTHSVKILAKDRLRKNTFILSIKTLVAEKWTCPNILQVSPFCFSSCFHALSSIQQVGSSVFLFFNLYIFPIYNIVFDLFTWCVTNLRILITWQDLWVSGLCKDLEVFFFFFFMVQRLVLPSLFHRKLEDFILRLPSSDFFSLYISSKTNDRSFFFSFQHDLTFNRFLDFVF